jgi:serine/threonine protein kinase
MTINTSSAAPALESGVQIGDFKIERRIGAGGMGIVYAARQLSLNRLVALKVLGQALTRGVDVSRFHREAQAAAMLRHPAIAQVYFIGQDQHLCYLAMELIDGVSLRQCVDRLSMEMNAGADIDTSSRSAEQPSEEAKVVRFDVATGEFAPDTKRNTPQSALNPYGSPEEPSRVSEAARTIRKRTAHVRRACEIARDAALALAHAHAQGVVHRDIKPDNLLLDKQGKVHLIDFGVARFFDDQTLTYTGQIVGTPIYMSPEQITGQKTIDGRTDIYSLGLVLCELLTLRPPVESTSRENVFRSIITKAMPPLSWSNPSVSPELEAVVHKASAKDPDARYETAQEFADDLQRYLDGQPVLAPPYRYRFDEGEIIAARPSGVVLSGFITALVASFIALICICMTILTLAMIVGDSSQASTTGSIILVAFQGLLGFVILAGGIFLTWQLFAGRAWARWATLVIALLQIAICLGILFIMGFTFLAQWAAPPPTTSPPSSVQSLRPMMMGIVLMYAVPILIGIILGAAVAYFLLSRKAANWFRLASRIRAEHRNMQSKLQQQ